MMIGKIFYRLAFGSIQFKTCFFLYFPHTSKCLVLYEQAYLNMTSRLGSYSLPQRAIQVLLEAIPRMG